jgi:formylglycine-generating enzyme
MPLTISVPDSLRASVEAATGGRQTVLYTALGQPTFMYVQPQFTGAAVGVTGYTDPHPMFYGTDGSAKSQYFAGVYPGVVKNGELLSLPGQDPSHTLNHDQFVAAARACGTGFHVMTNTAYAGIALWCRANSFQPRGNTATGSAHDAAWETGRISGDGRTATGSGPASWRHDNSSSGISDLCGNVWEWAPGVRVNNGEIQVLRNDGSSTIPKNDGVINAIDMAAGSSKWWAIDGEAATTNCFVAPGSANTVKYATSGTTAQTLVRASGSSFEGMVSYVTGAGAVLVLKALGLMPVASLLGGTIAAPAANGDVFYVNTGIEALPIRGGYWVDSADAGVFSLYCSAGRSTAVDSIGARPAWVL